MYVCIHGCMHACMHACMYACMYDMNNDDVSMYVIMGMLMICDDTSTLQQLHRTKSHRCRNPQGPNHEKILQSDSQLWLYNSCYFISTKPLWRFNIAMENHNDYLMNIGNSSVNGQISIAMYFFPEGSCIYIELYTYIYTHKKHYKAV